MEKRSISRKKFIRLGAASLGAVGVAGAAACGGAEGGSGGKDVRQGKVIVKEAGLKPGSALEFTDAGTGKPCVLVHLEDGKFVAYSAECTHQGCTVSYKIGNSGGGYLGCPCHNSVFEPAEAGRVLSGPADAPLPRIPIEARDGKVFRA